MKIENYISVQRVEHSKRVSEKAVELATAYNLDIEVCRIAGLLHDIGKNIKVPENEDRVIFHCRAGVEIAKNDFNITDKRILDAILYHTTAHADMDDYAKVIYIADKIEDGRDYEDAKYLRQLVGLPLNAIVGEVINSSKKYHKQLHPWTINLLDEWGINE